MLRMSDMGRGVKAAALVVATALFVVGPTGVGDAADNEAPPVGVASAFVCPSGHNRYDIHLWLHVTKWCLEPGVRKQKQLKVQMLIHNRDRRHSLDLGQERIRLIVHWFDRRRWSPPRIGSPTRDRPVRTVYEGKRVWAIPANAERAYDLIPHQPGVGTFATHWRVSRLSPGATLRPHYHYGDLVFYMPTPPSRRPAIRNIVGVAYVKNADIIALCPPSKWEKHVTSGSF